MGHLPPRTFRAALLATCALVLAHIAFYAVDLTRAPDQASAAPYAIGPIRKADRVLLIVVDSLPIRTAEDEAYMPRLVATMKRGASGVLWASKQTGTQQGILGLGTGMRTSSFDFLRLFSDAPYEGWTIFDDLYNRGEGVSFNGDPKWTHAFGRRGAHNYASHGEEATFLAEDLRAIDNVSRQLASASPPALTVLHVNETDFAAHQLGTLSPAYHEVMRRWDATLDDLIRRALSGGATVILTSDHGNDAWGSHGGGGDIYRRVPVVMIGKGIRPAHGFEMNSVDMPATLALLLGTRLPGGALASPATAPIDLSPAEEAQALIRAYKHLAAMASPGEPEPLSQTAERLDALHKAEAAGDHAQTIAAARPALAALAIALEPTRRLRFAGGAWMIALFLAGVALIGLAAPTAAPRAAPLWSFALVAALAAFAIAPATAGPALALLTTCLAVFAFLALRRLGLGRRRLLAACFALTLLLADIALAIRFRHGAPLRALIAWARSSRAGLAAVALVLLVSLVSLVASLARRDGRARAWLSGALRGVVARPIVPLALAFIVWSALLPVSTMSALFLCVLVLALHRAEVPVRRAALIVLAFTGYFVIATFVGWPHLGERPISRYAVGLPAAAIAAAWLARGPLRGIGAGARASLVILLVLFPFAYLRLATGHYAVDLAAAELSLVALGVIGFRGARSFPSAAAALAAAVAIALPGPTAIAVALAASAAALAIEARSPRRGREAWIARSCILATALASMSKPEDTPSVVALFAALLGATELMAAEVGADLLLGVMAATAVLGRYAFFEVFGHAAVPAPLYGIIHLDLGVGVAAGENLNLGRATAFVILKVALASALIVATLATAPAFALPYRRLRAALVAASALTLLDLSQTAARIDLSVGAEAEWFEPSLISLCIRSILYMSLVLAYALVAGLAVRPDRSTLDRMDHT